MLSKIDYDLRMLASFRGEMSCCRTDRFCIAAKRLPYSGKRGSQLSSNRVPFIWLPTPLPIVQKSETDFSAAGKLWPNGFGITFLRGGAVRQMIAHPLQFKSSANAEAVKP